MDEWQGVCWVCVIFFPRLAPRTICCVGRIWGVTRGEAVPTVGVRGNALAKIGFCVDPLIGGSADGFVHGFGVRWFSAPGIL